MDMPRSSTGTRHRRSLGGVAALMIAVACFALISWSVKSTWQSAPVYGTARSLRIGDAGIRRAAVRELEGFTPGEAGVAVPALLEALGDRDAEVAAAAARALGKKWDAILRSGADRGLVRAVVPGLLEALEDTRPGVRVAAAEGLGFLHGSIPVAEKGDRTGLVEAGPPVRALADRLADGSAEVRRAAAAALRTVGAAYRVPPPGGLFTALEQDPSIPVRAEAARALGHFREGLDPAAFALLKALGEKSPRVRGAAAEGLQAIYALGRGQAGNSRHSALSTASVPPLIEALGSRNTQVRYHAASLLSRRDPEAQAAIPRPAGRTGRARPCEAARGADRPGVLPGASGSRNRGRECPGRDRAGHPALGRGRRGPRRGAREPRPLAEALRGRRDPHEVLRRAGK
jgi:HEAT repeat protein